MRNYTRDASLMPSASESQNVLFYHADHLGSSNVITDVSGALVQESSHYPFGEVRDSFRIEGSFSSGLAYHFTGKELDGNTGLHYLDARYLFGSTGRFLSVDPAVSGTILENLDNPQFFNSYAYAANRPIVARDPDGKFVNFIVGAVVGAVVDATVQVAANLATGKSALADFSITSVVVSAGIGALTSGGSAVAQLGTSGVKAFAKQAVKAAAKEFSTKAFAKEAAKDLGIAVVGKGIEIGTALAARKAGIGGRSSAILGAGSSAIFGLGSSTAKLASGGANALRQGVSEVAGRTFSTVKGFIDASQPTTYEDARNQVLGADIAGPISESDFQNAQN